MFALKHLPLTLLITAMVGAAPALALEPPAGGTPHPHGTAQQKIAGSVDFRLELHSVTAHHREMTDKHNEVMGFTGSHVLAVQLLDPQTGQTLTKLAPTVRVLGPDKQVLADKLVLKWFAPPGRAPYYGAGLNLRAKSTYMIFVTVMRGKVPATTTFSLTAH